MAQAQRKNDDAPLGYHDGHKILSQRIIINKTGDGLSQAVDIAPSVVETDSERNIAGRIHHRKTRFDNVYTKPDKDSDDEPELKGVVQVDIFDAVVIMFDERPGADAALDEMRVLIADKAAREREAKSGQFRLPDATEPGPGSEDAGLKDRVDGDNVRDIGSAGG